MLTLLRALTPRLEYVELARINGKGLVAEGLPDLGRMLQFVKDTPYGWDLYCAYGSRRFAVKTHGGADTVGHLVAVWCDLDNGASEPDTHFPPSVRIASGGLTPSGKDREWWLWLLKEPWAMADEKERGRAETINKALASLYDGCASWGIEHLARLPGTDNFCRLAGGKPKPLPEGFTAPRLARILEWHQERRYDPSDLEDWLGAVNGAAAPTVAVEFSSELPDAADVLQKVVDAGCSDETIGMIAEGDIPDSFKSRSERDQSVVSRLVADADLSDDEILALFVAYPVGDRMREKGGNGYLQRTIAKAQAAPSVEIVFPAVRTSPAPETEAPTLPAECWLPPFAAYREAVAESTEAADAHHFFALAAVAAAFLGRRVAVPYGRLTFPPLYVALIGPTGDKKTTAQRHAGEVADILALDRLTALGSSEGLTDWLAEREMTPEQLAAFINWRKGNSIDFALLYPEHRRGLLILEELATLLLKASTDGASTLITTLTNLYDQPDTYNPQLRGRRAMAEKPTLGLLAASTAAWVEMYLKASDVAGGFGNRFIWATGPSKPPKPLPPLPDKAKLEAVADTIANAYGHWQPGTVFGLSTAARATWGRFYVDFTARQGRDNSPTAELTKRIPEHAMKLALLYAAMEGMAATIGDEHISAAVKAAEYLQASTQYALGEGVLGGVSTQKQIEDKVLKVLAAGPMPKRDVQGKVKSRKWTARDFNAAVDALLKSGAVQTDKETKNLGLTPDD